MTAEASTAPQKRSLPRRIAVITAKVFGVLLLVIILAVGGAIVWLRTDSAAQLVADTAVKALADQGMTLHMDSMTGPLPQDLSIKGLRLEDDKGVLITAREVALKLHLSALFSGTVQIDQILLDAPEIFRLPASAPKTEPEPQEPPAEPGSIPVLPVDIILGELAVREGKLHTNALHPPKEAAQPSDKAAQPSAKAAQADTIPADTGPIVDFGASLSAALRGTALNADIKAELKDPAGQGITAAIGLEAAVHSLLGMGGEHDGDKLTLDITGDETPGGPLSQIAGQDIPGYKVSLTGEGPVSDWRGALRVVLDPPPPAASGPSSPPKTPRPHTAHLVESTTDFTLRCATGSFWKDIVLEPDFTVALQSATRPGPAAPAGWRPVMGNALKANVDAAAKGHTYTLKASVDSPALSLLLSGVEAAPYKADAQNAPAWKTSEGNTPASGTAVKADLRADITNLSALAAMGGGEAKPLPLDAVSFTTALSALAGPEFTGLESKGGLALKAGGEGYTADHRVSLALEGGDVQLKDFFLHGLGITATAKAAVTEQMQSVKAQVALEAKDHAPWQALVAKVASMPLGPHGEAPLGGALTLQANVALTGMPPAGAASPEEKASPAPEQKDAPAHSSRTTPAFEQDFAALLVGVAHAAEPSPETAGKGPRADAPAVQVTTDAMPSPQEAAAKAAPAKPAPPMRAEGEIVFTGTDMRWPTEQLAHMVGPTVKAVAHLSGGNNAPYVLRLDSLDAGIFSAKGRAALSQAKVLEAKFNAAVSDLTPLAGEASGVKGALAVDLDAKGPLDNLNVGLDVTSASIGLPQGELKNIALKTRSHIQNKAAGLTAGGTVAADIGGSPGGPVSLDTGWDAFVPANQGASGPLTAKVKDLVLSGAGLDMRGALNVLMRTDTPGAKPAINGGITLAAKDWKKIGALAGTPLSGSPATVDVRLASQGKQSATVKVSAPSLSIKDPKAADPTLLLQGVALDLAAGDVFNAPTINMNLRTGRGLAGPLRWRTGEGFVKGDAAKGNFALALHRRANQKAPGKKSVGNDQLNLKGDYDLKKGEVTLANFVFADPGTQTGLRTQKPLVVKLGKGVTAKGVDIGFWPSGKLTADAVMAEGGALDVNASLDALPFSFLRMFTPATLPGGALSAKAKFAAAPGRQPKLALDVQTRISATKPTDDAASVSPALAKEKGGVLAFNLKGEFTQSPGAAAAPGSGVRSMGGITWFKGTGSFGNSARADGAKEGKLLIQAPMRVAANGMPAPDAAAPMAVSLKWDGPIESLWQAVPMPDRYLTGPARFTVNVAGSMNKPKPSLSAYLAGVRFESIPDGLLINGIDLEVVSKDANNVHAVLSASDNASGTFGLVADVKGLQSPAPSINLRGQLKEFKPLHRDDLRIALSGIFGVNGPLSTAAVTGDIIVDEGEVILSSKLGGSVTQLDGVVHRRGKGGNKSTDAKTPAPGNATAAAVKPEKAPPAAVKNGKTKPIQTAAAGGKKSASAKSGKGTKKADTAKDGDEKTPELTGPALDLRIRILQHFFIRGMGLDSEWGGDLKITGVASAPQLVGSLKPIRGYLDFMSRYFVFDGGDISFYGGSQINPALNLVLMNEGPDITAYIRAGGTAKKPTISFDSTPPMPRDEILSHVIFGKRSSDLSRLEAIQLANSLAQLSSGNLAPDVLSGVRKKIGLDMLRLGGSHTEQQRSTSGASGEQNLTGKQESDHSDSALPTIEAGKYVTDHVYVGVEQGLSTDSTAVRVDVELSPKVHMEGKTSSRSSEVGLGWKMDY